jgi:conjugal transfer pilus assembly protein TraK
VQPTALLLGLLVAIEASGVRALQRIEARDGVSVEAAIALKEPTRIKIEGAAISDVFGNIYSTTCGSAPPAGMPGTPAAAPAINPSGEIVLECDRDKGEIYVKPVATGAKPVNLFVSSGKATYTLILKRVDMPADTIVIVDRSIRRASSSTDSVLSGRPAMNHERALKAMLVAMAGDTPSDMRVEEVNRPLALWAEAQFVLLRTYDSRGLIGEVYRLTNVSNGPMVLAEEEFDRERADVVAVSVETQQLDPGESTNVFVIRLGEASWRN